MLQHRVAKVEANSMEWKYCLMKQLEQLHWWLVCVQIWFKYTKLSQIGITILTNPSPMLMVQQVHNL
jgi:hypothetical protein